MAAASWWAHEARRCGKQAIVLPVLAALLASAAVAAGPGAGVVLDRALLSCALPTATALVCAAAVAREPMLELHLSLPTPYPRTVARRLAWPGSVASIAALALAGLVAATGHRPGPVVTLLELAGLTAFLSGAAVWSAVRTGSAAPSAGLVVAVVLAKLLLIDQVVPEGVGQAIPALLAGAWLTALALRALGPAGRPGARLGSGAGAHVGPREA
ncbi:MULTISPECIES: hypothetical protein [unclassified Streptomyces]|uniref:hypothetical protein n=1 Tax=unclassified Streptomyces TaxID=2593676 RepID=UPI0036EFB033